jgi:hypothetical protein
MWPWLIANECFGRVLIIIDSSFERRVSVRYDEEGKNISTGERNTTSRFALQLARATRASTAGRAGLTLSESAAGCLRKQDLGETSPQQTTSTVSTSAEMVISFSARVRARKSRYYRSFTDHIKSKIANQNPRSVRWAVLV